MTTYRQAPELRISEWLNAKAPITLQQLRGRVVVLHAFQMLCPGCVLHGIPQAERIRETFSEQDVAVLGLHTVFEHHDVMTPDALRAFMHEYRVSIPVGIDLPSEGSPIPHTMQALQLRGTPSLVIIDKAGKIRFHLFGRVDDMQIGAQIAALVAEPIATWEMIQPPIEGSADNPAPQNGSGQCSMHECEMTRI